MNQFLESLSHKKAFHAMSGVLSDVVECAEGALSLKFASDYEEYLLKYGIASIEGHELTGLGSTKRIDVVENTLLERHNQAVPSDWYVIEQAGIDGIVIWQSSSGEIYRTMPNAEPIKLCNSLSEYLDL